MGNCCAAPKTEFQGSRRRRCPGSGDIEKFDLGIVSHSTESGAMEKFDPITEDAFMEILLRLPVRAILRCRVLSKFHRALIDSPDFIRKHCHQSMKQTTTYRTYFMIRDDYETITWMPDKRRPDDRYHSMDFTEDDSNNYVAELDRIRFINHPLGYLHNYDHEFYIVGCCMGIVAFLYTTRACQPEPGIFFYNPSTRKYRTITLNLNDDYKDGADQRYFLGYDTVTEDMKLLQILNKRGTSSVAEQLYVYGSRMDSWKKIQGFNNQWPNLYLLGISEVFVEGTNCLHMPAFDSDHYTIVTFNFSTESFSLAPLPPDPGFTTRKVGEAPFWPASLSGCFVYTVGKKGLLLPCG